MLPKHIDAIALIVIALALLARSAVPSPAPFPGAVKAADFRVDELRHPNTCPLTRALSLYFR